LQNQQEEVRLRIKAEAIEATRLKTLGPDKDIVINMSGRGDKDMPQIARIMGVEV
jgi:tryptophan synthase beta subunit